MWDIFATTYLDPDSPLELHSFRTSDEEGKDATTTGIRARVTYNDPDDRFSVSGFVDNLTYEEYFTFGQNALGAQGVAYNYLGRPREYGVTLSARF